MSSLNIAQQYPPPTRVFVTGGTGFIGKHLIRTLIAEGISVVALARDPSRLPAGVEAVLESDLLHLSIASVSDFLTNNNVDVVVHLGAAMQFYPKEKAYVWKVNVEATKKLATASAQARVKKFIFLSTTETMGGGKSLSSPYDEETACSPVFYYGSSKLAAEQAIKETNQLPYVILRATGVLGPGDDFVMYELIQTVSYGLLFFTPKNSGKVMFTHVHDIVAGIMCAIPHRRDILNKTYVLCPDTYMTYAEAIHYVSQEVHRISPFMELPIPVIRTVTYLLGPPLNLFREKRFLFKTDSVDRMGEDRWYSNEKAKQELGYKPKYNFQQAIGHTIKHMTEKGELCTWYISPVAAVLLALLTSVVIYLCK